MNWLAAILTWFAADAEAIDRERPRAAAACQVAHASMMREVNDAAEDQDASAALGEPGAGIAAEAGQEQPGDGSGERILQQGSQSVEASCPDGSCVAMPGVRSRLFRSR